jgi:F0F1-type ATP synthase epsilon subunit
MSTIRNGKLAIYRTSGGEPERIAIEGGFAEVNDQGLTVLASGDDHHMDLLGADQLFGGH